MRSDRELFRDAISPRPEQGGNDRWELTLKLVDNYSELHTLHSRVAAFGLVGKTYWGDAGKLLEKPRVVHKTAWNRYQVHHLNKIHFDNSWINLAIVTKPFHSICLLRGCTKSRRAQQANYGSCTFYELLESRQAEN